ncbi:hypothetical protein CHUAL_005699 [Chamberlinius hualienensis]
MFHVVWGSSPVKIKYLSKLVCEFGVNLDYDRVKMDVDSDVDQSFLQQFSCMGTTDKDVLIDELQKLVGNQLNATGCAFFLDMNNWNLQAAVCAYFDYESPRDKLPLMSLVRDVTIGEGESVPPNTKFIKTWRVQNTGDEQWPPRCCLRFAHGCRMEAIEHVLVGAISPGEVTDISVEMVSPDKAGIYQGQWRMCTATGFYFGDVIWVIVTVAEDGVLSLTQQMSRFSDLGTSPKDLTMGVGTTIVMPNGITTTTNSNSMVTMANGKPGPNEVWTIPAPSSSTTPYTQSPKNQGEEEDMMA